MMGGGLRGEGLVVHGLDPRLTPARRDLAAASLEGRVKADRYVIGERRTIIAEIADIRRAPRPDAPLETQAVFGETVTLFDEDEEGWGWVQLAADGYVGYIAMLALDVERSHATHVVTANRTFVYPAPDMKRPIAMALSIGAKLAIDGTDGLFSRRVGGGFVFSPHLARLDGVETDFVAVAERLVHTPYLWGGKSALGIDCSGLVQVALARAGLAVPRDTDMQEKAIGVAIDPTSLPRRGDLIFWAGHVGIMRDTMTLLHANAHSMRVASEPLQEAVERIFIATRAGVRAIRRLSLP